MASNHKANLRVGTLNVRGFSAKRRQQQVKRLLVENSLDVLAVQETKIESEEQTDRMVHLYDALYYVCVSHAVGTSGGCALLLSKSVGIDVEQVTSCSEGRLIVCDFGFTASKWRIVCVYAPTRTNDRKRFFENIEPFLNSERNVLLLGDFNCVCKPSDRVSNLPIRDTSAVFLNAMLHDLTFEDVGCLLSGGKLTEYTHFQRDSHARLDRIYVSAGLVPLCSSYEVKHVSFSDHSLVTLSLGRRKTKNQFNWALWKFNSKLLQDDAFVDKVNVKLKALLKVEPKDIITKWENFKHEIKMDAMERACILRHEERKKEKELQLQLEFLLGVETVQPGKFTDAIREVKAQLELIDVDRYRGAAIRARAEKLWLGEAPTKRSLGEEKRYARQNEIAAIDYHGQVTHDSATICQAFVEHYRELIGKEWYTEGDFTRNFLQMMPRLDDEVRECLEGPISLSEIERAIDELGMGKSPGPDGIGACFYKAFKSDLAMILYCVLREAYDGKRLPKSFRHSHIVLIPKSDDPVKLLSVKGFRPISLTNVDYKIFMKVLASRLQAVITRIVGPHQTCGIKGRSIQTNIHVARSILECVDALGGQVAVLQLDLEKAFDRVNHKILFEILEHVNVGSIILEGVKMSYSDCSASLIINKKISNSFQIRSSVKQGCPLAPLLFALYLEPFCLKVLYNDSVRGFRLHESEVKILAYADDIAVICAEKESISEAVNDAVTYCKQTGSMINWDKTTGFWHGTWASTPATYANAQWTTIPSRYLGVPLDQYKDTNEYWEAETERVRGKTTKWGGRDLSMFGRATVCNLFLVAKIWYVLQVLYMTRVQVQKLHRVFAVFIWSSSWERTSRTNLFRSVRCGGLGLVHLFLRQVVSRFAFLRDQRDGFLRTMIQLRLSDALPDFVVSSCAVRGSTARGYLREVVLAYQFLKARFSLDYLSMVTRKRLYKDLIDVTLPVPLYRSIHSAGAGQDVLKRVKKMPVRSSAKSFFFQLHSGTLPVKPWLQEKGLFVPWGIDCIICRKPETMEHIFLDCSDAVFHWDILQRTLKKDLPISPYGIRFLPTDNDDGVPYDMLIVVSLHSLWKTRMAVRHADVNARPAREYFKESIAWIRDVYNSQNEPPTWMNVLNDLVALKQF